MFKIFDAIIGVGIIVCLLAAITAVMLVLFGTPMP
jgi:hypothetical protein